MTEVSPSGRPAHARATDRADRSFTLETVVGVVFVAYNAGGISAVIQTADAVAFADEFERRVRRPVVTDPSPPSDLKELLRERLAGEQTSVRFDLRGQTPFSAAVLEKTAEIPYGEIRPYAWVAREIGHPLAVRAVGSALAQNPIPLFIPCHRVVRSDGRIGNFGLGGPEAKRLLLQAEGLDPDRLETSAAKGIRFIGDRSTRRSCFPTCRHVRGIAEANRTLFDSAAAARDAGYQPCSACRPFIAVCERSFIVCSHTDPQLLAQGT